MQTIELSLYEKTTVIPVLWAKQQEVGRKFQVVFAEDIPEGVTFSVWYSGASGSGNYTTIGDASAFAIDGNTVTVEMIAQMLNNAGEGKLCLIMTGGDGLELGTWNIKYEVEHRPGLGSHPAEQYYQALRKLEEAAEAAVEAAEDAAERAAQAAVDVSLSAVCYTKQEATEEQRAQARKNIGVSAPVKCSKIGMTLDDADSQNIVKLANAINSGASIIVDGLYRLKAGYATIDKDVILKGADTESGFSYEGTTEAVFIITKNVRYIDMHGLSFVNNRASGAGILFYNVSSGENDLNIEKFSVCNCSFDGGFSLYRKSGDRLYNSSETLSTVKEFIFSKNRVQDQSYSFCDLADTCFETVEITHNRFNNFLHTAFNFATENLPSSPTAAQTAKYNRLSANKGKILADGNYIFCDDDCVLDGATGYYSFLVAECDTVVYTNNHIEGMKASYKAPLYDAYLSAANVTAEHSVWKNYLCFAAIPSGEEKNNNLMKAKGGGGIKSYRKNTYHITEDFLAMLQEKYSADLANCYIGLISITDDTKWDIEENYIEIASSLLFFTSNVSASRFNFSNNIVIANDIRESLFVPKGVDAETLFVNNVIRSDNCTNGISLCGSAKNPGGSCHILNNTIILPKAKFYGSDYFDKRWIVRGNHFEACRIRYFYFTDFLDNEMKAENDCEEICGMHTTDTHQRFSLNLTDYQNGVPVKIVFGAETSVTMYRLRRVDKADGKYYGADAVVKVYYDDAGTQKISVTNAMTGEVLHDGALCPETTADLQFFKDAIRLVLRSGGKSSLETKYMKSGIYYIERETIITG